MGNQSCDRGSNRQRESGYYGNRPNPPASRQFPIFCQQSGLEAVSSHAGAQQEVQQVMKYPARLEEERAHRSPRQGSESQFHGKISSSSQENEPAEKRDGFARCIR